MFSRHLPPLLALLLLIGCARGDQLLAENQPGAGVVFGVVTWAGKPFIRMQYHPVKCAAFTAQPDEKGYFVAEGVPAGDHRLCMRTGVSSSETPLNTIRVTRGGGPVDASFDMAPYYCAEQGPFYWDFRLHRDWNNGLDDPLTVSAVASLFENTHTFSGWVLKPVYTAAGAGDVAWSLSGGLFIGCPLAFGPKYFGGREEINRLSWTLLAGFFVFDAAAKAVEIPAKTILWPIDWVWAYPERQKLNQTRRAIIEAHQKK